MRERIISWLYFLHTFFESLCDRSFFPHSYRSSVNFDYWSEESWCSTGKYLIRNVELCQINSSFFYPDILHMSNFKNRFSIDTLKNIIGNSGSYQCIISHEKNIGSRELTNMTVEIKENSIIIPTINCILFCENTIYICPIYFCSWWDTKIRISSPYRSLESCTILGKDWFSFVEKYRECSMNSLRARTWNKLINMDSCSCKYGLLWLICLYKCLDSLCKYIKRWTFIRKFHTYEFCWILKSFKVFLNSKCKKAISIFQYWKYCVDWESIENCRWGYMKRCLIGINNSLIEPNPWENMSHNWNFLWNLIVFDSLRRQENLPKEVGFYEGSNISVTYLFSFHLNM